MLLKKFNQIIKTLNHFIFYIILIEKKIKISKTNYSIHYFGYNFSFQTNYYFSTYTNLEAMSTSQVFVIFENVLLTI